MTTTSGERADLLEALTMHRALLRRTAMGLTDDQARERTTISELTLGGLIKHVAATEAGWARFVVEGTSAMAIGEDFDWSARQREFTLLPDETLEGVLAGYEQVAADTEELVRTVDLDLSTRCRRHRGSHPARAGRRGGCSCTSWPRRPSTRATPTSCERRSTVRSRWADAAAANVR